MDGGQRWNSEDQSVGPLSRRGVLMAMGAVLGALAVGGPNATGRVAGQESADDEEEEADGAEGEETGEDTDGDGGDNGVEVIEVDDNFYEPDAITVQPGTTVQWVWVGQAGHNINPTEQPDSADWEGHPDIVTDGEHEHTFEVEGEYHYVCDPHVAQGMVGDVVVDPDAAGDAGAGPVELVPDAAWTLVIATVAVMISVLSLIYGFLRYGGPAK